MSPASNRTGCQKFVPSPKFFIQPEQFLPPDKTIFESTMAALSGTGQVSGIDLPKAKIYIQTLKKNEAGILAREMYLSNWNEISDFLKDCENQETAIITTPPNADGRSILLTAYNCPKSDSITPKTLLTTVVERGMLSGLYLQEGGPLPIVVKDAVTR